MNQQISKVASKHPPWLKVRAPFGPRVHELKTLIGGLKLNTVCEEARCPNIGECWHHGVATFMILGDVCTRGCRYCAVDKGKPLSVDFTEPDRVAEAVKTMNLRHAVITSVDRDDLEDGGAGVFVETVLAIRSLNTQCVVELLIPDFGGSAEALKKVLDVQPEVLNHNIETVPRLFPKARGGGEYHVSLELLQRAKKWAPEIVTKTGMMFGLGEREDEIRQVFGDLVQRGVSILTLGQYLCPSSWHLPVRRYYHPDEFCYWGGIAKEMGFDHVESGPLVRSSYLADRQFASLSRSLKT